MRTSIKGASSLATMSPEANSAHDYRVLVLAPTRRDREVTRELLQRAKISCALCQGALSMAAEIETAAGAILLTDAAFSDPHIDQLLAALSRQPPWSEVPIILLCRTGSPLPVAARVVDSLRNVTVLERPTSSRTLLSSVQAALRARARQYQLREQFEALRASEAAVRDSELQFRTMVNSIPQLAWMAHPDGYIHWYNHRWYEYTGTTPKRCRDGAGRACMIRRTCRRFWSAGGRQLLRARRSTWSFPCAPRTAGSACS